MNKNISEQQLSLFEKKVKSFPGHDLIEDAVSHNGILAATENRQAKIESDPSFSIELPVGKVANQQHSGRCWLFAALNTMRHFMQKKHHLADNFELSQNYLYFWDKLEKSNYFLENILTTATFPLTDRKVSWLLKMPQMDGGQWDMFTALVQKYGVVPQSAMPESYNSDNSSTLNSLLNLKLREGAKDLRKLFSETDSEKVLLKKKEQILGDVYQLLVFSLGEPPQKFDFNFRNQAGEYVVNKNLSPQDFYHEYIDWPLDDFVSIINSPTEDKPYQKLYTIEMLGNVVGGRPIRHLNVDLNTFRSLAIQQLKDNTCVWFGCDVRKDSSRQQGILHIELYEREKLFKNRVTLNKGERLEFGESLMTHAMVLTGVDLANNTPLKWKVENSWGDQVGHQGFFVMNDQWFSEYCYQLVINKKYLSNELRTVLEEKPIMLAPWDPMGALAD